MDYHLLHHVKIPVDVTVQPTLGFLFVCTQAYFGSCLLLACYLCVFHSVFGWRKHQCLVDAWPFVS